MLFLTSNFPRRPGDNYGLFVSLLARELARRGHQITLLAPHDANLPTEESEGNLTIRRFPYFFPPARQQLCYRGGMISSLRRGLLPKLQLLTFLAAEYRALRQALQREKFDLLHYHWALPQGLVTAWAKAQQRLPVIGTYYGGDVSVFSRGWGAKLLGRAAKGTDLIVSISRATQAALCANLTSVESDTAIIFAPVEAERFLAGKTLPIPEGFPATGPVLFCVGRLVREKGFENAIKALPLVRQTYPQATLIIAGDGPEASRLKSLAETTLEPGAVRFPGFVPAEQLPAYYAQADVFLLPSVKDISGWQEGLGLVVVEAALAGCPAVATKVGGTEDTIREGETGLLVPERDPAALAEAAVKIIASPEMRRRLAEAGREFAEEHFSPAAIADKYEAAYGKALIRRGRGPEQ